MHRASTALAPIVLGALIAAGTACSSDTSTGPATDGGPADVGVDTCGACPGDAEPARADGGAPSDAQPGGDAEESPADAANVDAATEDAAAVDAGPRDPLAGMGTVTRVQGGFGFLEGPVWRASAGVLLFSDLNTSTIFALTPPSTVAPFRMPSGGANGLAIDPDGLLLAAEHASRAVTRTLANGQIVTLAHLFEGQSINSPNDLTVRRSDGTIYFTDPPWGLNGRPREVPFNGVYRIAPDGTLTAERRYPTSVNPNGINLSPDERTLYVADDQGAVVNAFDVALDGTLSNERLFVRTAPTPDGMAIDRDGNLYVATQAGVEVFAPDGTRWGAITVAEQPANCAFGGAAGTTLYITARTGLYQVELSIPGGE